jgi:hypothetical protein
MYRESHDGLGKACILVDDKEVLSCSAIKFDRLVYDPHSGFKRVKGAHYSVYKRRQFTPWTGENPETGDKAYSTEAFFEAVGFLFDNPISASLDHFNDIVFCLALVDRRTGKRTLIKLKEEIAKRSGLVKFFYGLRCDAEFKMPV